MLILYQQDQICVNTVCRQVHPDEMASLTAVVSLHACDGVDSVDACESWSQCQCCVWALYLMFALHPAHSNVILIGFPCPFLPKEWTKIKLCLLHMCVCQISIISAVCFCMCVQQNEPYLAVKHLITCHVIQLYSVQVISAKHTKQKRNVSI